MEIIQNPHAPIYKVSFEGDTLRKRIHPNRRVGRPRMNWTEETIKEIWDHLKKDNDAYKYMAFDGESTEHMAYIKNKAQVETYKHGNKHIQAYR
jgi:hypothetical protein